MKEIRILIVQDEDIHRLNLETFILELGYKLLTSTNNSEDAIRTINHEKPDIVILDVEITGHLNGIELAEKFRHSSTKFLFLTSTTERSKYDEAKETAFIGYIVKPFNQLTLQSIIEFSIEKALKVDSIDKQKGQDNLLIKHNAQLFKTHFDKILYIEAKGKLCIIYTENKTLISNTTLSKLKLKLPSNTFSQIHKSYIINLTQITKIVSKNNEIFIEQNVLPIGRIYKEQFLNQFHIL